MEHNSLNGFAFSKHQPDKNVNRGYSQRSLVILSVSDAVGVMQELTKRIGTACFDLPGESTEREIVSKACSDLCNWLGILSSHAYLIH